MINEHIYCPDIPNDRKKTDRSFQGLFKHQYIKNKATSKQQTPYCSGDEVKVTICLLSDPNTRDVIIKATINFSLFYYQVLGVFVFKGDVTREFVFKFNDAFTLPLLWPTLMNHRNKTRYQA